MDDKNIDYLVFCDFKIFGFGTHQFEVIDPYGMYHGVFQTLDDAKDFIRQECELPVSTDDD